MQGHSYTADYALNRKTILMQRCQKYVNTIAMLLLLLQPVLPLE